MLKMKAASQAAALGISNARAQLCHATVTQVPLAVLDVYTMGGDYKNNVAEISSPGQWCLLGQLHMLLHHLMMMMMMMMMMLVIKSV